MEHNHVMGRDQLFYNVSWASFIPSCPSILLQDSNQNQSPKITTKKNL